MTLAHTSDYDFGTGLARLRFRGGLDVSGAAALRAAVLKSLSDHPMAVLVDLRHVKVTDGGCLLVLPKLAAHRTGTPLYFIAEGHSETGALVRKAPALSAVAFDSEAAALESFVLGGHPSRRLHLHLEGRGAPCAARRLVAQACAIWDLPHLLRHAELIASELVANAVLHAGTDADVVVARGARYLRISVRDRAGHLLPRQSTDAVARTRDSRGLRLIDKLASGWGTTLTPFGKTVWATLRLEPAGLTSSSARQSAPAGG